MSSSKKTITVVCPRCNGTGHYSFNYRDGSMCLQCCGAKTVTILESSYKARLKRQAIAAKRIEDERKAHEARMAQLAADKETEERECSAFINELTRRFAVMRVLENIYPHDEQIMYLYYTAQGLLFHMFRIPMAQLSSWTAIKAHSDKLLRLIAVIPQGGRRFRDGVDNIKALDGYFYKIGRVWLLTATEATLDSINRPDSYIEFVG